MQRVVARGWNYCLVLEDDAILHKNFRRGVENALQELKQNYSGVPCVTFIGSGGNWYTPRSQRRKGQHLYPAHKGRLTDSYIIGQEAAALRLGWIEKHKMDQAIDNAFNKMDHDLGITLLWLEPTVVEQGTKRGLFNSTLAGRWPAPVQGFMHGWEKLRRKYIYQLWR
jgi:glycosyl transferase family 25